MCAARLLPQGSTVLKQPATQWTIIIITSYTQRHISTHASDAYSAPLFTICPLRYPHINNCCQLGNSQLDDCLCSSAWSNSTRAYLIPFLSTQLLSQHFSWYAAGCTIGCSAQLSLTNGCDTQDSMLHHPPCFHLANLPTSQCTALPSFTHTFQRTLCCYIYISQYSSPTSI